MKKENISQSENRVTLNTLQINGFECFSSIQSIKYHVIKLKNEICLKKRFISLENEANGGNN